jgi:SAM-dependent methyltransferase
MSRVKQYLIANNAKQVYIALFYMKRFLCVIWAYMRFYGKKYTCIMCGRRMRRFIPFGYDIPSLRELNVVGGMKHQESACPYCFSINRERLIYLYMKKMTDIFSRPMHVLHFAPERNVQKRLAQQPHIEYITADINSPWADKKMDVMQIEYPANTFDFVICNHVLEHVSKDTLAMREIYRVLKPGGQAIVQVPISTVLTQTREDKRIISPKEREQVFGQYDHVRIYTQKDYVKRLKSTGAIVHTYNCFHLLGSELIEKNRLIKEENVYVMKKPKQKETQKKKASPEVFAKC